MPHPQAPNNDDARMYKVLRDVTESTSTGQKGCTTLTVGGRVRGEQAKEMLSKQLQVGLQSLEEQGQLDGASGIIRNKKAKAKKEKTPAQLALAELRVLNNKLLGVYMSCSRVLRHTHKTLRLKKLGADIPAVLEEMKNHSVRNSSELVS